jgi:hypothetical protein
VEENQEYPEYPNPWRYNGVPFDGSLIRDFYGFVYNITNLKNQRQYIGRKYFWQRRKPRPTTKIPDQGELRLKVTGENTTVVVQSLKRMLIGSERNPLEELY